MTMTEAQEQKEEGNKLFAAGKFEEAIACYTKALKICPAEEKKDKAVYFKNRSQCHLKLENYNAAANDASKALDINPNDPKGLFRRCQALEKLGRSEEAYKDAMALIKLEPKNKAIHPIMMRLHAAVSQKAAMANTTDNRVTQMFKIALDDTPDRDKEKSLTAANNLVVLAKEDAGANKIIQEGGIPKLCSMLEMRDAEMVLAAIRVLACMSQENKDRARVILHGVTMKKICMLIGSKIQTVTTAATHLIQTIMKALTDVDTYWSDYAKHQEERKKGSSTARFRDWHLDVETQKEVDMFFDALIHMMSHYKVSGIGRDSVLELITKNIDRLSGIHWTRNFLESTDGMGHLMEVSGTIKDHDTLEVTPHTHTLASMCLQKIWDDTMSDKERDIYNTKVDEYFSEMFGDTIAESKIEAIVALTALLQGPLDVGNRILGREGITDIMLVMTESTVPMHQRVAVEALVASTAKKDRCVGIVKPAVPILKKIYQESVHDNIKVRALVGLCKLGSSGGSDITAKTMADGSTLTLARACRKYLKNPAKDADLRKWATEGLAYLTLDAEVKEELVEDEEALRSLIDLAKQGDKSVLYPAMTVFVNLSNSYDKPDILPELKEMAKFAKQHVPEDHEKDGEEFFMERIRKMVKNGMINALVAFSTTDSRSSKELIARVALSVVMEMEHRGLMVQQGGAKALIPLALDGTDICRSLASQTLAKIAITADPSIAYPGQRVCEVVRPCISLLEVDKPAIQNFEGLMALTNLASVSETVRKRIIKENGLTMIDHYMYEDHPKLRQAAVEAMCNMAYNDETIKFFKAPTSERTKLLLLYGGDYEEDMDVAKGALGALAILSEDPGICEKIVQVKSWIEIMETLAANENAALQHRGCHILLNMASHSKEHTEKIMQGNLFLILMAVSKLDDADRKLATKCASETLDKAAEYSIIKAAENGAEYPVPVVNQDE